MSSPGPAGETGRLRRLARSPGPPWALTGLILLLELATPPHIVFGYLYVIPLVIGAPHRGRRDALGYLALCCGLTLVNLVVPEPDPDWRAVLVDRLLVCLALTVTTFLCLHNRHLLRQQVDLEVRLAQADLRRDMIATLAHDLKTPVLGTIATARMMELEASPSPGGLLERGLVAILASQERSLRLIEDLLRLFRADQEGLRLQPESCDLGSLAAEAIEAVGPIAREREVTLIQRQPTGPGRLNLPGDPGGLRRLLENLLLNAINHSLRGERVWVDLQRQQGQAVVTVSDRGQGFPEASLPHLFERFYQSDPEQRGSGLGLYLSRQITEAHGGRIRASNLPAGGASIEVRLPLEEPPA
ncbi:HAMP domain-containing histidine kinase [Cyanobium sp. N.Huapi 1H5]|uniref:sensor histidine kinase n=1 Tax=Cyanobium sp. N.Huapi 1H5 TaxID=2823719 RepID=UPI0020CBFBF8|nr:HAMP domain-containing sensor histidine kinase [Cyanobium sp. N.Huapi 1H5]MCP9838181.1 HAMP domain-containing histidine kinase [Cyanobium sp. N.Huapi 1H5]